MIVFSTLLLAGLSLLPRDGTAVATTDHFTFYSDVRLNLHDELNRLTRADAQGDAPTCFDALSTEHRRGWSEAVAFYREHLSNLQLRGKEMSDVRARILDRDEAEPGNELVDSIFHHIDQARPAYEACLWEQQDALNRAWIASVVPRVRKHEIALTARLSELFQHPWPSSHIPVDLVGWVSDSGANTIDEPPHIMMSSISEGYREDAGLEMVFHEASHLLIDARYGKVAEEIARANAGRMLPRRDLWHTILFFTVGQVTKERLAATGTEGYVPFLYKRGLIERGWRPYREPLETHWQAYIDGKIDLATAADRLLQAIHTP